MSAHAKLSPSGAHRWGHCAAAPKMEEGLPDTVTIHSAEGTLAHHVLERSLLLGLEPDVFAGQKRTIDGFKLVVTDEMVGHVRDVMERVLERGGQQFYEMRVSMDKWIPEGFGTLDIGIVTDDYIFIEDLKYGAGEAVHPKENEQLLIYALGFCAWLNANGIPIGKRKIKLTIHQPRNGEGGGSWTTDLEYLLAFGKKVRKWAEAAWDKDNMTFNPGEKTCRWCKAKGTCKALAEYNLKTMKTRFSKLADPDATPEQKLPDIEKLDAETRSLILKHHAMISDWLKALHRTALEDALAGRPVPGMKAIYGRAPHRTWPDEELTVKWLEKNGLPTHAEPKVLSPAAVETIIKKEFPAKTKKEDRERMFTTFNKLYAQGDPKAILVSADHSAPEIPPAKARFAKIADDDDEG